jgi:hypothetical protein
MTITDNDPILRDMALKRLAYLVWVLQHEAGSRAAEEAYLLDVGRDRPEAHAKACWRLVEAQRRVTAAWEAVRAEGLPVAEPMVIGLPIDA